MEIAVQEEELESPFGSVRDVGKRGLGSDLGARHYSTKQGRVSRVTC